jgi:hypothetical protein
LLLSCSFQEKTGFVALMLNHHPTLSLTGEIQEKPIVQWAWTHCKRICELVASEAGWEMNTAFSGRPFSAEGKVIVS